MPPKKRRAVTKTNTSRRSQACEDSNPPKRPKDNSGMDASGKNALAQQATPSQDPTLSDEARQRLRTLDGDWQSVDWLCSHHSLSDIHCVEIRRCLLDWYDIHQRRLPWRQPTIRGEKNDKPKYHGNSAQCKAYAVLVSEIMLQQTQVATVIPYYERWMTKWPTAKHLAQATIEDVRKMWAGLGYYSRGTRLHKAAHVIVTELDGTMPQRAQELQQKLPGVGPYTAAAVASIAFEEPIGVVDGNVYRVLSRLCAIGADIGEDVVQKGFWKMANQLVDPLRPGDFNQAMMELGATVCTPKAPACNTCCLREHCAAFRKQQQSKQASAATFFSPRSKSKTAGKSQCPLCLPAVSNPESYVEQFPRKAKKKPTPEVCLATFVLRCRRDGKDEVLIRQRPASGLLASLWEFPNLACNTAPSKVEPSMLADAGVSSCSPKGLSFCGTVKHVFSHVRHTYYVYSGQASSSRAQVSVMSSNEATTVQDERWVTVDELDHYIHSTNMKKVLACASNTSFKGTNSKAAT